MAVPLNGLGSAEDTRQVYGEGTLGAEGAAIMTSLDYMTDETFRAALLSDLKELDSALESGNVKSVHVLAGSVVEAVLIEHLISASLVTPADGLKLELADAIQRCRGHNIISQRTADMSSVVRSYRNLIHPGRVIRLNERITGKTAVVAQALAGIVIDEIAAVRTENYGWTAEQILSKLYRDSNVEPILVHLLKQAPKTELKRLLLKVLPEADKDTPESDFDDPPPPHFRAALTACFRAALEAVDEPTRKEVAARFASMVRSDTDAVIESYGDRFFRPGDLSLMADEDQAIVKAHLFGRMQKGVRPKLLLMLSGVGAFLRTEDVLKFIDPIVQAVLLPDSPVEVSVAVQFLTSEQLVTTAEVDAAMLKRLDAWKRRAAERKDAAATEAVGALSNAVHDFPF